MTEDTICAPSTPPVSSPIAIIRISGPETVRAIASLFVSSVDMKPRHARYGSFVHNGELVDDVIVVWYQSPRSYTGEDMAEIFCHGNPIIVQKIIMVLIGLGIRLAEPGEFTKRAFLNGKVDLTEAEAINHIITAKSEWEIETSLRQMHGSLRDAIGDIRNQIIEFKADIEAGIDFSEENIDAVQPEKMRWAAVHIQGLIEDLRGGCRTGEQLSHGIDITITGKPNVGKSSILNLLLNQERAIVSSIPGTTRDIIREPFQISGMRVNLVDTAGIDSPGDEIERLGIELSNRNIELSPFIIMVLDASTGLNEADWTILEKTRDKKRIILINKSDIAKQGDISKIQREVGEGAIPFSALNGEGLEVLKDEISRRINNEYVQIEHSFIADLRVVALLDNASAVSARITSLVSEGEPGEIVAFELQALIDILAEITGEITPDDILDSIFSRFCIGK